MSTRVAFAAGEIAPIRRSIQERASSLNNDDVFLDQRTLPVDAYRLFGDGSGALHFQDWRGNSATIRNKPRQHMSPEEIERSNRLLGELIARANRTLDEAWNELINDNFGIQRNPAGADNDDSDDDDEGGASTFGGAGSGSSSASQSAYSSLLAAQSSNGGGYPTPEQAGVAVDGLPLSEFTDELLGVLDPSLVISFEQTPNGDFIDAEVQSGVAGRDLNFITAMFISVNYGALIARSTWTDESGEICQWIAYVKGAFYIFTANERRVIRNDDLAEVDYRASNWLTSNNCVYEFDTYPAIGGESQSEKPTFDIKNPPCSVSEVS